MFPNILETKWLTLPTYLVLISLVYIICIIWAVSRSKKKSFDVNTTLDISLMIMIGGFIGARVTHIFFEQPGYYLKNPLDTLKFWQGGFVFFGGALGALIFTLPIFHVKRLDFWKWADLFSPVFSLGYALGRIGCFFSGCCFGKTCDLSWAVYFPRGVEAPAAVPLHPTQLYAVFGELLILLSLLLLEKYHLKFKILSKYFSVTGVLFLYWLTMHSMGRIVMEVFRADDRGATIAGLSLSTFISLIIIFVSMRLIRYKITKIYQGS